MTLTVGSLFSGIGGLELGLERAGMRVLWQVEKDEYARRVLARHWPGVPCFDDVRDVGAATLAPVDVLCGGFPCQDISAAGKRAGIDGKRSGLWSEFYRLVCELRPRYVLVENVSALLARGLGRILGDLAASGYDAEWDCIPAAAVGAPHRRDRLFLVAYPKRDALRLEPERHQWQGRRIREAIGRDTIALDDGAQWDVAHAEREPRQPRGPRDTEQGARGRNAGRGSQRADDVADAHRSGLEVGVFESARKKLEAAQRSRLPGDAWSVKPDMGGGPDGVSAWLDGSWERGVPRVALGVPARVDRLRCLGNAVVPQVAEVLGRLIVAHAKEAA